MSKQRKRPQIAEINVVPYIDVMLVLLVIFMVTAPLLFQGVNVDLPTASAKAVDSKQQEPIVVSVDSQGNYYLNISKNPTQIVSFQVLQDTITSELRMNNNPLQRQVLIKGDKRVDYGAVVQVMVLLQHAGVQNIGLITQPEN